VKHTQLMIFINVYPYNVGIHIILTLALLYILGVTCFIRKYCQPLELNSNVHNYNTRRRMDIHIKSYKTDIYKKSVINIGTDLFH
jgi:hypothetical protein